MDSTTRAASAWSRASLTKVAALCGAVALSAAAACGGGDSATGPSRDVIGAYKLQAIANSTLPVTVFDGSATDATNGNWYEQFIVTVKSGTLELDAQGYYHSSFDYTLVEDGVSVGRTLVADGTYSVTGTNVTLRRSDGKDVTSGSLENGQLTIDMTIMGDTDVKPYVFRK